MSADRTDHIGFLTIIRFILGHYRTSKISSQHIN